jgi:ABC-2 type transport system permease protein
MKWGMPVMQSSKSLLNKELIALIFRNTGWIGIVYFAGLIFALPLNVWMRATNEEPAYLTSYGHMFQVNFVLQAGLMLVIPVLLSVFLFRFLHVKQQADMIHSLPIRRESLFLYFSAAGLILLVLPVIFTAFFTGIVSFTHDLGANFQMADITRWALLTILMNVLFFVCGIAVAMLTGLSVVQAVLTYILLIFPSGMYVLSVLNLKNFLFGFPDEYFMAVQTENFSPVIKAGLFNEVQLSKIEVVIYLLMILIFFILALFLYKKRKIETVSQALVFPLLQPVFKFGLISSVMLVSGGYFSEVQNTLAWTVFGYILGFIVGYLLSEMILQKTWRIAFKVKEIAILAIFIAAISGFFHLGFRNYESYIPAENEIEKVYFNSHIYSYLEEYEEVPIRYLKKDENIQNVRELHQAIIAHRDSKGSEQLYIVYELKSGKKSVRRYEINQDHFDSLYENIYESVEYKESINEILSMDAANADKLTITAKGPYDKQVSFSEDALMTEAIEVLKKEVLEEPYESMVDQSEGLYDIEILLSNNRRVYVPWKPSYNGFKDWLIDKNLFEKVEVTSADVSKIIIFKRDDLEAEAGFEIDYNASIKSLEDKGKTLSVTSDPKVEDLLNITSWSRESDYLAAFYFKGTDYPDVKGISPENIPEYIRNHFDR